MCKRGMTEAGLKADNATNSVAWRKKIISYTGDLRRRNKQGMKKKKLNVCDMKGNICVSSPTYFTLDSGVLYFSSHSYLKAIL